MEPGILSAFISSIFLAGYYVYVRSASRKVSANAMIIFQLIAICGGSLPFSFIFESWTVFAHLPASLWVLFVFFALVIWVAGNILQVPAIQLLGAPLVCGLICSSGNAVL